jgi:hypothetical protein
MNEAGYFRPNGGSSKHGGKQGVGTKQRGEILRHGVPIAGSVDYRVAPLEPFDQVLVRIDQFGRVLSERRPIASIGPEPWGAQADDLMSFAFERSEHCPPDKPCRACQCHAAHHATSFSNRVNRADPTSSGSSWWSKACIPPQFLSLGERLRYIAQVLQPAAPD